MPALPQPSLAYGPGARHGCTPPVSLQHFVGVHSQRCDVPLHTAFGLLPPVHGLHEMFVPLHVSAMMPHCHPPGRSAGQLFGVQHVPDLQRSMPVQLHPVPHDGSDGHWQVPPWQVLAPVHAHGTTLPQLSVTDGQLLPQLAFAAWQVPALQHCKEPQPVHVTGATVLSTLTPPFGAGQLPWCTTPLQFVPHAAGPEQQAAPFTGLFAASRGVYVPPGQPHVTFTQPLKKLLR